MKIDLDTYREIVETLARNKARSLLTGFGVFWGVFMLVALLGGGQGLEQLLQANFAGFAHNSGILWASTTTKPYDGFKKGRSWQMNLRDLERLRQQVPEIEVITPMFSQSNVELVYGSKKFIATVKGRAPEFAQVQDLMMEHGRFLNSLDMAQQRKVCVIGKKIYQNLFPRGDNPCGKSLRVGSVYYTIVGVTSSSSNMNINGSEEESVSVPLEVMRRVYNKGNTVDMAFFTVRRGVTVSSITPHIQRVVAQAHHIDPTDEHAVEVFNTEVLFAMMDNLFTGVHILAWLVGIGTLLAGAIGVSNIMMVTVRERTAEIGIRRAIGATPRIILGQIITESLALTAVAGSAGLMLAVMVLQMLQLANTTDGVVKAHFQVPFFTAIGALAMLAILGAIAGLPPALRAMSIKPVEAMRDE